jgi:hypothetical protein
MAVQSEAQDAILWPCKRDETTQIFLSSSFSASYILYRCLAIFCFICWELRSLWEHHARGREWGRGLQER